MGEEEEEDGMGAYLIRGQMPLQPLMPWDPFLGLKSVKREEECEVMR